MKRWAAALWLICVLAAAWASTGEALTILPVVGLNRPKVFNVFRYQFGDLFATENVYGEARDTYSYVTKKVNGQFTIVSADEAQNGAFNAQIWDLRSPIEAVQNAFYIDLYPVNGYTHYHLGFADPLIGAPSYHIFGEPFPNGFGCYCNPGGGSDLSGGSYYGYGYTHYFPFLSLPICNWDGGTNPDGSLRPAPCPTWLQGRQSVSTHDGNEFNLFTVKDSKNNTSTFSPAVNFVLYAIDTGAGGDMEAWVLTPAGTFTIFSPIPANTHWTPAAPQAATMVFFHDWQSGVDASGNPAPRSSVVSVDLRIP